MSSTVTLMLLLLLLIDPSDPGDCTEAGVLHWLDRLLRVRRAPRSVEGRRDVAV